MAVTWSYNGSTSLAIVATGLTPSAWYSILGRDADSSQFQAQADGAGALSTTLTGIGDPGGVDGDPGASTHSFSVELLEVTDSIASDIVAYAGCNIFTFGVASAGTVSGSAWTFNGTTGVGVSYPSSATLEYRIRVFYHAGGGGGSWNGQQNGTWQAGTGGTDSRSLALSFTADAIQAYAVLEAREPGSSDPTYRFQMSNVMFTGGSTTVARGDPVFVPVTGWQFQLWNIADDTLVCDLTNAVTANESARLNRPLAQTWTLAGDNTCINTVHADTDLNLCVGTRTMKAYQDGVLVANTPVENIEWDGDENTSTVVVTGYNPLHRALTRIVYDSGGSFVKPSFSTPISGGDLIKQMVDNSVTYDDAVFDAVTPAVFPLSTTGTFDTSIPPAVDLSFDVPDGPSTIGEIVTLLTDTGAVDVVVTPTDTSLGAAVGIVGELSAVNKTGSDLTATVHFDYNTGDKNVAKCRVAHDMGTVGNRIIYELGPRRDAQHWQGNITATETTPVNLEEFLDAEMTSRAKYGTRTSISVYDSNGDENSARPLFHQLWETEVTLRVNPRRLLYMTPIAPSPFRPFIDFNLGDTVKVNVGAGLVGPALVAQTQRIYGFDVTIDADGVERLGELITSADAE